MDRRLLTLAAGMFAIGTDTFVIAGILAPAARSLDVSIETAGQLVTAYALAYALMSPVLAALTATWPRKKVLMAGLVIFTIGNIGVAALPSFAGVLASRVIAGIGAALFAPAASATAAAIVPADQRGRALAVVMAGLSAATALGAPIGVAIGAAADWRDTMWFVTAIGVIAGLAVAWRLDGIPAPPPVGLRQRLVPAADRRVALTLLTTFLLFAGLYAVYTYIGLVLARATGGDGTILAILLAVWGVASVIGNLGVGRLTDRWGNRRMIVIAAIAVALDFALMPWSSASLPLAAAAMIVWGIGGWGLGVPLQHRLFAIAPASAPLLAGLNATALYLGVSVGGVVGAAGVATFGAQGLGPLGAALVLAGLAVAEIAHTVIHRRTAAPA